MFYFYPLDSVGKENSGQATVALCSSTGFKKKTQFAGKTTAVTKPIFKSVPKIIVHSHFIYHR